MNTPSKENGQHPRIETSHSVDDTSSHAIQLSWQVRRGEEIGIRRASLYRITDLRTGEILGCVRALDQEDAMRKAYEAMIRADVIPPMDGILTTEAI